MAIPVVSISWMFFGKHSIRRLQEAVATEKRTQAQSQEQRQYERVLKLHEELGLKMGELLFPMSLQHNDETDRRAAVRLSAALAAKANAAKIAADAQTRRVEEERLAEEARLVAKAAAENEERNRQSASEKQSMFLAADIRALHHAGLDTMAEWLVQHRTGQRYKLLNGQYMLMPEVPPTAAISDYWLQAKPTAKQGSTLQRQSGGTSDDELDNAYDDFETVSVPTYSSINTSVYEDEDLTIASPWTPEVNTMGTPMIPGAWIDVQGNAYGNDQMGTI